MAPGSGIFTVWLRVSTSSLQKVETVLTLTSMLSRAARLNGGRTAIVDPEGRFSWNEFVDRVARAAGVLESLGVKRGGRFGIICRNSFRNAELINAGYWLGAVPVPVNYRLAPPEIAFIVDDAECNLVVVEDFFAGLLDAPELTARRGQILLVAPTATTAGFPQYEPLVERAEPMPLRDAAEDDDAILIYTGGTTGRAKGVRLSHRNIFSNAIQTGFVASARPDDVFLHVAPMFHSAEFLANPYILAGAAQVYLPSFSAGAMLEAIETHGVTSTLLTPTMLIMALEEPELDRYDLSSLRQVIYGSSPMAAEWIEKAVRRFEGVEFIQAYGLSETSPILTLLSMAEHLEAIEAGVPDVLKSVGRPVPGVDLKIVDPSDEEVAAGEPGEVVVRGPNIAKGYLKQPAKTAEAFRGEWFYTGDIGHLDDQGRLYLLDRKKDMIITGGENVYSLEVEAILYQHPKVHECAVIGIPDKKYGEALLAAIVPRPGEDLTGDELIEHCRGRIGGYKIPRNYVFLDVLPKSEMNKVLKHELRRIYGDETGRAA